MGGVETIIETIIEPVATFAMAHPVCFTVIALTSICAYGAYKITGIISNNRNRKDEDRRIGNRNGRIRYN